MLPEGVYEINEASRDEDGYYQVGSSITLVFPFTVPRGGSIVLNFVHHMPGTQDFSIRCWFSARAYGEVLFPQGDHVDVFAMPRLGRTIEVWDSQLVPEGDPRPALPAGTRAFFNVSNLQNSSNGYRLEFSA
jgi:hypothetical protein